MMTPQMRCSAGVGSMTQAMKAQQVLAKEAIPSHVMKMPSSRKGCTYGIGFDCVQEGNVRRLLEKASIGIKQWNTET